MPWYPRNCTWCGVPLAARTADPEVRVVCLACDPSPGIPLEPDGSDVTGQRGEAERIDAKYEQDIRTAIEAAP